MRKFLFHVRHFIRHIVLLVSLVSFNHSVISDCLSNVPLCKLTHLYQINPSTHISCQGGMIYIILLVKDLPAHEVLILITYANSEDTVSLRKCADSSEPALLVYPKYGCSNG